MNAERLLTHYEKIADAPDAILRLRRFILDLAVRGKLVPQDVNDEPASELLKRIAKEKARLVKGGEIRKPKELSSLDDRELAYAVPTGWTVAPLDSLSPRSLSDGDWIETKDQSEDGGVRLIQLADVGVGEFLNKSARYITEATEVRLNCTRLAVGDVLIARLPNPIGRACIFPDIGQPAITAVDVAILRPDSNVSAEFLVLAMNAPPVREQIEAYGKGATRFRVSTGHLKTVQIPLPPLAEQRRIVAKVDELMGLCDRLAAARAGREGSRDRLAAASLARLNAPDTSVRSGKVDTGFPSDRTDKDDSSPAKVGTGFASGDASENESTFQADARFALDALPALTTRPDQIKRLRQTILNLAVRGKLVPQDPNDEPASELLKQLKKARAALEAEGKIRKDKGDPPSHYGGEQDFDLPGSWSWARLTEIGQTQTGTSPSSANADLFGNFIPFIKPADLDGNQINYDGPGLSEIGISHSRLAAENSILMVCIGATLGKVNTTARPVCFNQQINSLTPFLDGLTAFIAMALKASDFQSLAWSKAGTGTLPIISKGKWEVLPIPLPPFGEQHRIVTKVDALMALCDRLEASLTATAATRRRLLDALLAEALAPVDAREMEGAE